MLVRVLDCVVRCTMSRVSFLEPRGDTCAYELQTPMEEARSMR